MPLSGAFSTHWFELQVCVAVQVPQLIVPPQPLGAVPQFWPPGQTVSLDARGEARLKALAEHLPPASLLQLAGLLQHWGQADRLRGLTGSIKKSLMH